MNKSLAKNKTRWYTLLVFSEHGVKLFPVKIRKERFHYSILQQAD